MRARGFSLMEVMIAIAIVAFMGAILGGTLMRQTEAREKIALYTERQNTARTALNRMAREISMAFLSKHYNCNERRTQTIFKGRANDRELLSFTSFSHYKWRKNAKESDQNELSYFIDTDPDEQGKRALMRKEWPRITDKIGEQGTAFVLAHDIDKVEIKYYDVDNDRWEDEWDTTRNERKMKLPLFVKISLSLPMPEGRKNETFTTATKIVLQKPLEFGPETCSRCGCNL